MCLSAQSCLSAPWLRANYQEANTQESCPNTSPCKSCIGDLLILSLYGPAQRAHPDLQRRCYIEVDRIDLGKALECVQARSIEQC